MDDVEKKLQVTLQSEITCPNCGHTEIETMPSDACQWFYDCKGCGALLKPLLGDCCVYCSYATVPCPPIQVSGEKCTGPSGSEAVTVLP